MLGTIYDIRFEIYRRKFFVKFLNNFIGQLTPFFFYSIGGYLVIKGNLSFGALVAVLAAYKDLASPWKELLDFYQNKENSRITYDQIVEQFQPADMVDAHLLLSEPEVMPHLTGELAVANLSLAERRQEPAGRRGQLHAGARRARRDHRPERQRQGRAGAAAGAAGRCPPAGGSRSAASTSPSCRSPWSAAASAMSARRRICSPARCATICCSACATVRCARPTTTRRPRASARSSWTRRAAPATSISTSTPTGSTTRAPGSPTAKRCRGASPRCCRELDFEEDVYGFGLRGRVDPDAQPELAARLLDARAALAGRLLVDGHHRAGRDLRCRALQHQCHSRREPAVRHPDRAGLRVRCAGRQHTMSDRCSTRSA